MHHCRKSLIALCFLILGTCTIDTHAQQKDSASTFSITGYIDAYYAYYTDSVGPGNNQKFSSTAPRSNSPSLNTAQLSVQYNADKIRGTAVFHFGDIATANWAPAPYNNIMEAHVGVKVYSKLWVDAGFFRTHFGTEFLLPSENITSTTTVGSYYEPFYESGIRLNFDPTTKLEINLFLLNGYNVFVDNNNKKSFGLGVTYVFNDRLNIGFTNYTGDDSPDASPLPHSRFANNAFLNYQKGKVKLQAGADVITQQNTRIAVTPASATMYSALLTGRYQAWKKTGIYARAEVFSDPDGILSPVIIDYTGTHTGYKLWGATAGVEYKPTPSSYIKLEGRRLQMNKDQYIFYDNGANYNYRYEVVLDAGVTFDLLKKI